VKSTVRNAPTPVLADSLVWIDWPSRLKKPTDLKLKYGFSKSAA
jgi:hypothetical protein